MPITISIILYIILLVAGFPAGLFLANLCKEEIKNWRKKLIILLTISLLLSIIISFTGFEFKYPIVITLFFIIIVCLTVIWKSY